MNYFKVCKDGRIIGVGTATGDAPGGAITAEEYASLSALLAACPGGGCALMEDTLAWELFVPAEGDLADSDALAIILGGDD